MKKILWFCLFSLSLASCLPKQKVLQSTGGRPPYQARPIERLPSAPAAVKSASAEAYINQYKDVAIQEMNKYGIPASIKLAQALLESGNGNSALARQSNNHFGIKCASGWTGRRVLKDDDHVDDCFRVYQHAEESFRDHSEFLLRKRYSSLFELNKNDYVGWARGLKQAGYATNPRYAELLISLIERYQLYQYDSSESVPEKIVREEKVFQEIVQNIPNEVKDSQAKPPVSMAIHEVKKGETLYAIADKYGLSVDSLKQLNDISDEVIIPGQLLLVSN